MANWGIKDYEARGGYQALRTHFGRTAAKALTQDQVIATVKESGLAWSRRCRVSYGAEVELHAPLSSLVKNIWCATLTRVSLVLARIATS
jgi:hypothetical protein